MARLIRSILANPRIALYVQHFTIDGYGEEWTSDEGQVSNVRQEHVEYTALHMAQLERAVRDSEYLSSKMKAMWILNMRHGREGREFILIALALTFFPNLTSIDLQSSDHFNLYAWQKLDRLLTEMLDHVADKKHPRGLCNKLVSVNMSGSSGAHFLDSRLPNALITLPSVRIVNAKQIHGRRMSPTMVSGPMRYSNATDLNIVECGISPDRLTMVLQRFIKLESFTYWPRGSPQRDNDFDPFKIVTALLACAQDSLRELQIRAGSVEKQFMGVLGRFRVLEYVDTDTGLLVGAHAFLFQSFQGSLPRSIRGLKLHGWITPFRHLRMLLISLGESKADFPNLGSIEIFEWKFGVVEAMELQDICHSADISLTLEESGHVSPPTFTRHSRAYAQREAKKAMNQREGL